MTCKFKPGDKVVLKTGSAVMTIKEQVATHTSHGTSPIINRYECVWNNGDKMQQTVFIEDVLKIASND